MRSRAPSEVRRLAAPLARPLDAAWARLHWWVVAMAVLYALSGVGVVGPDEVAIVKRWGRLVSDAHGAQVHGPGLLFAFPRPVDEVVRVKTKYVQEQAITTLARGADGSAWSHTLDPITVGYALTGDRNVVHVRMVARFQVRDPAVWAFRGPKSADIVRTEVTAAMVRSLGEFEVDRVLAEKRRDLIDTATRRAQEGLDAAHSGLALISLELTELAPPQALAADFDAVQSAYIGAETQRKEAKAFAQDVVPRARAFADSATQTARADAAASLARARGDVDAFLALQREVAANAVIVRERLYRDAVENAIAAAGAVRWIPPPVGGRYDGLQLLVPSDAPSAAAAAEMAKQSRGAAQPAGADSNRAGGGK